MGTSVVLYIMPLLASTVILIGLVIIAWRHRTKPAARTFIASILALLIWTMGNIFGLLAPQLAAKIFWDNVQFIGITFLPLLWLNLTLDVTERGSLPRLLQRIMIATAVATNLIAWTNPYHLFRVNPQLVTDTLPFPLLDSDYGLWRNWVHLPYFYLTLIVSIGLLLATLVQASAIYRRQHALLILASVLVPLVPGTLYVLDIAPFQNWNPATSLLGVSGILIALAQLRFHLFDLVPIARTTLIETMTDAVIVLDDQNRLLDLNPAAQWLIDTPPDKTMGQPASQVFGQYPELLDFVQGGGAARADILITTRENERHYEVNHTPLLDSKNRVKGHLLVLHDITLHKQSDEALKESRQRLYDIINFLPDATFAIDMQGKVIAWNKTIEQLTGVRQEELLGKDAYAYAIPFYGEARPMLIDLVITGQEAIKQYYDYVTIRDTLIVGEAPTPYLYKGRGAYLWGVAGPLFDNAGKQIGAIECIRDITDRKQAAEERENLLQQIQQQAHQVRQIVETVPEGVLLLDNKACVTLANALGEQHLHALAGARVGDALTHLGDHPLADLFISPPHGLWHTVSVDRQHFEIIARPLANGIRQEDWVLVIRDVTQQREIEYRAQQQERLAAVGQLAAGIAHDFNNILAVITLYAKMSLRVPDLPAKLQERLEIIDQQAWRASSLVQQILDFSRRTVLERSPLDLRSLLEEQVKLLKRTLPEHIALTFTCDPGTYSVNADPTRLQQAFLNLATNARDAMPNGGELHLSLKHLHLDDHAQPSAQQFPPELTPGEWIQVTLADTGSGIPESILPHLFEPFHTTKAPGRGTGLGLSQVYGIIRQHEGYIDVHTEPDKGTTLLLYLPALITPVSESRPLPMEHLLLGQEQVILIVEDNPAARQALVQTLQLLNYRTREAANGREALQLLDQQDAAQAMEDRVA
ncbi:MAG: histidine kinase N-terminal 7TM domain-containing protein, partial [Anaerolineae bacterium]|nr:histidine kinase N-terminal 7TM domain-containing protein [Anaerolineae bacterium]